MDLNNLKAASTITIELEHPETSEKLSGFNVTCYAPTSLKYRSAVMKVAKKYADVDSKKFIDMDDNEIDQALTKSTNAVIDTVSEVVTGCNLVMAGEDLTVEQLKSLIKKEEYYWLVAQVKGELDAGKLVIKKSAAS